MSGKQEITQALDLFPLKPNILLKPGAVLRQKYQIEKILAEGGMGRVYQAHNLETGDKLAIKQLLTRLDGDNAEVTERFKREYYFLNSIEHENLVKAYELLQEEQGLFLVLEFAEGIPLRTLIQEEPRSLSLAEQIAIGNQISRAIEVLNTAGILHRDIKPANIMLNRNTGRIKLLDLGIGKAVGKESWELTQRGAILGTTEYLSPEQANGEISERSDVFSLGLTLYQFLLWEPHSPFKGQQSVSVIMEIMTKELASLADQIHKKAKETGWAVTPAEKQAYAALSPLLAKTLAKEPEQRPTAGEVADEMEKIYQTLSQSTVATTESTKKTENWCVTARAHISQIEKLRKLGEKYGRDEIMERRHKRVSRRLQPANTKRPAKAERFYLVAIGVALATILAGGWLLAYINSVQQENKKLLQNSQHWQKEWRSNLDTLQDLQKEKQALQDSLSKLQADYTKLQTEYNRLKLLRAGDGK